MGERCLSEPKHSAKYGKFSAKLGDGSYPDISPGFCGKPESIDMTALDAKTLIST